MSQGQSSFDEFAFEAAREFLQTVVVLDDEAYLQAPEDDPVELETPGDRDGDETEEEVEVQPQGRPTSSGHQLDAKVLMDAFAEHGLVCSVLRVEAGDDLRDAMLRTAERADVVILDWQIRNDDGDAAKNLVKAILERDADRGGRMRLISVYTGEKDVEKCCNALKAHLAEHVAFGDGRSFTAGNAKVTFVPKAGGLGDINGEEVSEADLPDRVIQEFSDMTHGLLPNIATRAVSTIRRETHRILARFDKQLDGAFLSHRILLTTPDDAEEFALELLKDEFHSVLESRSLEDQSTAQRRLQDWINAYDQQANSRFMVIDDLDKKTEAEVKAATVVNWVIAGKSSVQKSWRNTLFKRIYPLFYQDVAEGASQHRQFSRLSAFRREANSDVAMPEAWCPSLTQGTVVQSLGSNNTPTYYVCLQPLCDCVRIGADVQRAFVFMPLTEKTSSFDIVVAGADGEDLTLKFEGSPMNVSLRVFDGATADAGRIVATSKGGRFVFETANGESLVWLGDLRRPIAARFVHIVATELSRVGLDEFEWQRLFAR